MISYPWTLNWKGLGQEIDEFPYFKRWFDELGRRPGVQRGMAAGSELSVDTSKLTPEQAESVRKLLYNQRARPAPPGGLL
jgi:GST-like protein